MVSDIAAKVVESTGDCPFCNKGTLIKGEGQLDQSGEQYLPTATWTCPKCSYKHWDRVPPGVQPLPYFPVSAYLHKSGERCACGEHIMHQDELFNDESREDDDRGGKHGWRHCPPEGM